MGLAPKFLITADGADVTAAIAARLISIRMTDETDTLSDSLEIDLADNDQSAPIPMPRTGAQLELYLGYDSATARMGMFVCDEVQFAGPPDVMKITARAAPFEGTSEGKTSLSTQKTRSWDNGTILGDMVAKIASDHGMKSNIAASMKSIVLPHFSQTSESDISFLHRILKGYDGVVKPAGGVIVVIKRGDSTTASGDDLPTIVLDKSQCTTWHLTISRREKPGTVTAFYHDTMKSRRVPVAVGEGDPVKELRHHYPDQASAQAAAQAHLDKNKRKQQKLSLTTPGVTNIISDCNLVLTGFRDPINGTWLITKVDHGLTPKGGYSCSIEAELPTDAEDEDSGSNEPNTNADPAPAGGAPVQTGAATVPAKPSSDQAAAQAAFKIVKDAWNVERDKASALLTQSYAAQDSGDYSGAKTLNDQAKAVLNAANAKYSAAYDQAKAKVDAA